MRRTQRLHTRIGANVNTPTHVIYRIWVSYRAYGADQHKHQRMYNQNGWVMNRYTREELAVHAQQYYEYSLGYCAEVERIQIPF